MKYIYSHKDLEFAYYFLRVAPVTAENVGALGRLKAEIRAFQRDQDARSARHVIRDDTDSCIVKITLPTTVQDAEEAERWFTETELIDYIPSPYDCTGQLFTRWHKTRRREDGRFVCYHSIGYDV